MIYTATVTQKGQVTIPVDIRRMFRIKPYEKIAFKKTSKTVELLPAVNFLSLKGSIKAKKNYSDKNADKGVTAFVKKRYE